MAVIQAVDSWEIETQESRMKKGPLVRVELQPGRFVKKYQADAVEEGYAEDGDGVWRLSAEPKKKGSKPQETKIRKPQEDKSRPAPEEDGTKAEAPEPLEPSGLAPDEDFTVIDGVGPATQRALAAHGIKTFEALREADLSFLSGQALAAIQEWRSESGTGDV